MADDDFVLMTALILHYENGDTIYETLDSIFIQDYPRIELVVSDDCSKAFSAKDIENYIEQNRRPNIERVVVRKNERNLGTVAHLEKIREETQGDIELLIGADDCWHDGEVFSDFAHLFEELGSKAEFITSQIEMCDEKLDKVESLFLSPSVQQMLRNNDMRSLLDLESSVCALAGSGSAFRKSYFEKLGKLSEHYSVVEDWPAHVRWLRMGECIYYLDRVTLKHRHGGISHSAKRDWSPHYLAYCKDAEQVFPAEIEPYKHLFSPSSYEKAERAHELSQAYRCSLEHSVSVIFLVAVGKNAGKTINSIMTQNCMNYEVVIGCNQDLADWVISFTNTRFIESHRIRRIRLVPMCESEMKNWRSRLENEVRSDICVTIMPGEKFTDSSSLLAFVAQKVERISFQQNEKPVVERIEISDGKKQPRRSIKLGDGTKKSILTFAQVSKMKEDILYSAFAAGGICLLEVFNPPFGVVCSVLLGIVLVATLAILIARIGLFFLRCFRNATH